MSHTVELIVPTPQNAVRAQDHPILETGNISFPEGRYTLEMEKGNDNSSYTITHHISGAQLITKLLTERLAQFVCIVSSPISSYRRTHVSMDPQHEVRWNDDELGESPMFTPMIVCSKEHEIKLDAKRDGLHKIWDAQKVKLQKGSRLALGSVIRLESSIVHLLSFDEDNSLLEGQFFVELKSEPFRFGVKVSTGLHKFIQYDRGDHRSNIMTHIVTACFARLQQECRESEGEFGLKSDQTLQAFGDYLESQGHRHWTDEDFRPELVATALYPHKLPKTETDEAKKEDSSG